MPWTFWFLSEWPWNKCVRCKNSAYAPQHTTSICNRRFRNNCEIVEELNSSSKNHVRVKFFFLKSSNNVFPLNFKKFLTHMGMVLGISAKYTSTISQLFRKRLLRGCKVILQSFCGASNRTCFAYVKDKIVCISPRITHTDKVIGPVV